ncbi:uncharacterized protein LOC144580125 [Callithrix jacchus]
MAGLRVPGASASMSRHRHRARGKLATEVQEVNLLDTAWPSQFLSCPGGLTRRSQLQRVPSARGFQAPRGPRESPVRTWAPPRAAPTQEPAANVPGSVFTPRPGTGGGRRGLRSHAPGCGLPGPLRAALHHALPAVFLRPAGLAAALLQALGPMGAAPGSPRRKGPGQCSPLRPRAPSGFPQITSKDGEGDGKQRELEGDDNMEDQLSLSGFFWKLGMKLLKAQAWQLLVSEHFSFLPSCEEGT